VHATRAYFESIQIGSIRKMASPRCLRTNESDLLARAVRALGDWDGKANEDSRAHSAIWLACNTLVRLVKPAATEGCSRGAVIPDSGING